MSQQKTSQYIERAERLANQTRLSTREAELYVLKTEEDMTITQAAEYMDIGRGNAASKWDSIKRKIEEAKRTAKLDLD